MAEYESFGALWEHANGDDMEGKIYGTAVILRPNERKEPGDRFPDWRIYPPGIDQQAIGALWLRTAKTSGAEYLSGAIEIAGQKRQVALWPAKQNKPTSPRYRVMPPRDEMPPPPPEPAPVAIDEEDLPF